MSKFFKIGFVGLLAFAALAVVLTGSAFAQDDTPPTPESFGWRGGGFGRLPGGGAGFEAAAEALGMSVEELDNQLWAGETLASLAEEAGVDLAGLRATVQEARNGAMREIIEQAVENGNLDEGHADWLLEGLDNGWLRGPGFGGRGGFRGVHRGLGGFPGVDRLSPSDGG